MRRLLLLGLTAFAATGPALAVTSPAALEATARRLEKAIAEPAGAMLFGAGTVLVAWQVGRRHRS